MKKIVVILTIFSLSAFGQNPYYDAIELKKLDHTVDNDTVAFYIGQDSLLLHICSKYAGGTTDYNVLSDTFSDNPFIRIGEDDGASILVAPPGKSLIQNISGLDVTTVARGISMFLIDRAKEELNAAFFNRLKNYFEDHKEIEVLFPKTASALTTLVSYHYSEMLPTLRTQFYEDLKLLPIHIDDVIELPAYRDLLTNFPEIRIMVKSIGLINTMVVDSVHPAEIIKDFAAFPEWAEKPGDGKFQNFKSSVKISAILSNSVRYHDEDNSNTHQGWVKPTQLRKLIEDETAFKIYLGLIYQQVKNASLKVFDKSGSSARAETYIENNSTNLFLFRNYVFEFVIIGEKVTSQIKKLESADKVTLEEASLYIATALDVIEYGGNVAKLFKEDLEIDPYIGLARNANDIVLNAYRENYTAAVSNAVYILSSIQKLTDEEDLEKPIRNIQKYGLFIANVVEAKDAEDVSNAIEAAALPVGSSGIKKRSNFNISLQAHLGGIYREHVSSPQIAWETQWAVTAPIGVSFNLGLNRWGAIGINAVLIDLGAMVDYELSLDTITTNVDGNSTSVVYENADYKVELGQIFSPGAYLTYSFPYQIPLALSIGGQYGPGLARIESSGSTIIEPSWRWGMSLTVDIPLFTLSNWEKKKIN